MLAIVEIADLDAVLQIVREHGVLLNQLAVFKVPELIQGILNGCLRHPRVQAANAVLQYVVIERACIIAHDIRAIHMGIAQILKQLDN